MAQLNLTGSADVGGRFSGPDLGDWSADQPALWTLILFGVLVLVILGIAHSLR